MRSYGISSRRRERFAGILAYGGWLGGPGYAKRNYCEGMAVAMINGNRDQGANQWVSHDTGVLMGHRCQVRYFTFPGGHQMAPIATSLRAIEWLEQTWLAAEKLPLQ